ncbi:MAG: energy transducer TonB [Proteobacteria bacterium]|nr:energy transducer TonB [Pseudomonadota bacterium]
MPKHEAQHEAQPKPASGPSSEPNSDPPRRRFDLAAWLPTRRTWLWVLLAFVGGLLLFALVLPRGGEEDLYRADDTAPAATGARYAPLPAPLPAGADRNASGLGEARDSAPAPAGDDERPQLVETPAPPPPQPAAPAAAEVATAAISQPVPIPGRMPAPRYPSRAYRRGESGTVVVQADIGPDGVPSSVSVASSSGSRALDRAAIDAVRRWRFRPAETQGQPVAGTVHIPIEFDPR